MTPINDACILRVRYRVAPTPRACVCVCVQRMCALLGCCVLFGNVCVAGVHTAGHKDFVQSARLKVKVSGEAIASVCRSDVLPSSHNHPHYSAHDGMASHVSTKHDTSLSNMSKGHVPLL